MIKQQGDTIIEVIFAVTVFSMVALGGMALMNQGAAMAQRSLEISLVRDQMDAQADGLRYLHDAYMTGAGQDADSPVTRAWNAVAKDHAVSANAAPAFSSISDGQRCTPPAVSGGTNVSRPYALDITHLDNPDKVVLNYDNTPSDQQVPVSQHVVNGSTDPLLATTYAQVRYTPDAPQTVAQGIWIIPVYTPKNTQITGSTNTNPLAYYDFNIYACWMTPGQSAPVTLGTVVRLYDPKA